MACAPLLLLAVVRGFGPRPQNRFVSGPCKKLQVDADVTLLEARSRLQSVHESIFVEAGLKCDSLLRSNCKYCD